MQHLEVGETGGHTNGQHDFGQGLLRAIATQGSPELKALFGPHEPTTPETEVPSLPLQPVQRDQPPAGAA
jgi:hypothetical protein